MVELCRENKYDQKTDHRERNSREMMPRIPQKSESMDSRISSLLKRRGRDVVPMYFQSFL
jgi:hypothetical protein